MSKSKFNPLIAASMMSAVYLAGVSNVSNAVVLGNEGIDTVVTNTVASFVNLPEANALGQRRYIIQFHEEAVARYSGNREFAAIPRRADNKIEVNSPAVDAYVNHLKAQQQDFLQDVSATLNRNVNQIFSYQYSINGMVLELTAEEAAQLTSNGNVKNISPDMEYSLDTDAGPQLIGADNVWMGNVPASGSAFGEGVVLGILDSGANFDHPSFADVGGDGYNHTNPLGTGNFLGVCDPTNADQFLATYTCNDKIIGGYDFINDITPASGFDIEGPEDENGHGTHTASTAGGNVVLDAAVNGVTDISISGVASRANIVPFDVCYNPDPAKGGGCFGSATVASIDQILADGIVDVVNYSISGGTNPWTGAVELAFLSATDSGVFVSASAGNSGPGPATLGHLEPWTSSVGASTHNREFESTLSIVGEPTLDGIAWNTSNGPDPSGLFDVPTGIESSTNVDAANFEGCNPFAAGSFAGQIALISRGACSFADKVANAEAGNAVGVIIYNNAAGPLNMNVGDVTTIPSISIFQVDGQAIVDFLAPPPAPLGGGGPQVLINSPIIVLDGQADVMAGFSSRGPSNFEYNKPDVTGPGVSILAGFADTDPAIGTEAEYGVISGTSMSSPHNAGAAALLMELNPGWSVPEIKSALMLTAVTAGVTKEDGTTPADPFDRGAGRIQVDVASSTGLVMDETAFRFLLADPNDGGDPKTLNVPSYKNDNCLGVCSFQRKFTSVADEPVEYDVSLVDMPGTVNPANFTVNPGQTVTVDVEIDGAALPAGDVSFGELVLTPVITGGLPLAISDAAYDGSLATMACTTIAVSGASASSEMTIDLGIDHTWIGDLVVKLVNPDGLELGLMSRPGVDEAADDGAAPPFGDSSNLLATSPINFSDASANSAETMGDVGGNDDVVCELDGVCDFAPAPGAVAQPPATLAEMLTGTNDGDWMLCVGDSGAGDSGSIVSVALNFPGVVPGPVAEIPELHLPLVVTGLPDAPDITVAPASLAATLDSNMTTDLTLNISNSDVAGADLNWVFGTGDVAVDFVLQNDGSVTTGFQSGQYQPDGDIGAYPSDDFTVGAEASIESMFFRGFVSVANVSDPEPDLNTVATSVNVQIFADAAGVPGGHPEDGLNSAVVAFDIPINDPSLDLTGNGITVDVVAFNGGPLVLPPGTYWVTVFPSQTIGSGDDGRWIWFAAGATPAGATTHLIAPNALFGGAVPDWAPLPPLLAPPNNVLFEQMDYRASGTITCGAPWITTSSAGSALAPGADIDVTVTLDSTGVAPGVYTATLCVDSDDPDEPQVLVPVTMTVEGLPDLIFENGFEAVAP